MSKVVVDTNILISGLIATGPSHILLSLWRNKQFILITSHPLMNELITALTRPKITRRISAIDAKDFVKLLAEKAVMTTPDIKIDECRDSKDNKVLECAVAGKADSIVTGDEDLLVLNPFRNVEIIRVRDFIKRFE